MKLSAFLKDKSLLLLLHFICAAVLAGFLHITGYAAANITLICIVWALILGAWLSAAYLSRRSYFREASRILEQMDKRYLLGEMLPDSFLLEDKLYREMIHRSNKSVIEKIRRLEDAERDYREYLESWVHEIKAPITAISLLCENGKVWYAGKVAASGQTSGEAPSRNSITYVMQETFRNISLENRKIENCVDQVLYYARSEQVHKDYLIQETDLQTVVYEVLEKEHTLLIQNHVQAEVSCQDKVFTDKKWIAFILNQLILNSVKYCGSAPVLHFYTRPVKNSVILTVEDNGTGILPEDLPRIFEKGFTGSNGRSQKNATGMGLYLCRKLCGQLGIGLSAQSEYGKGTTMLLTFPLNSYIPLH